MTRTITPHKGGRTIKKSLDVTPEIAALLSRLHKQYKLSLGDLVEQATQQKTKELKMETAYNQINLKEWKTVNTWQNGESTYSERGAKQRAEQHTEWLADLEAAGQSGWHELEVSEDDVPSHQHGMEVKVSGDGQYLYIRDVTQAMGGDSETLYRRTDQTMEVDWGTIVAAHPHLEQAIAEYPTMFQDLSAMRWIRTPENRGYLEYFQTINNAPRYCLFLTRGEVIVKEMLGSGGMTVFDTRTRKEANYVRT